MAIRNLLEDSMEDMDADNQLTSLVPISEKATVDPTIIDALTKQILAQNTSSKWQGGVDAQTAAKDMAKIMAGIGITDIRQFGIIEQVAPEEVKQDGKGGYVDQQGRPVDPSIVTPQSYQTEGGEISYYTAPIGKIQNFGNKITGQLVPNTYGERQGGNAFGGTYEGKGNTGYRVDFTPDGTPIFYTTGASSSDVQDWMPLLQLGLAVTGAGGLLGNALLGGGASQVASSMLGNAILGGVTTGIAGGDILKGALTAGAAAGIAPATEMVLGKIPDFNALSNPVKAAVTNAVSGTIMNKGEITPAVLASALAAGLGAAGKDAELAKFESERTESGLAGQTSLTEEDMRKLGIVSDANLPTGTQVAGPMTLAVGGVPLFAESSGASAIRPPAGYQVMSATLADNKPAGAYYDASINAWLQPTNEFAKVTDIDRLIADMETFKSGINTLDANAVKGIVDQSLSELPTLTADDITKIIGSQNFARPEDIQSAISSIKLPQGLTNQDVQSIVSTALTNNPSLTTEQVSQIVNSALSNIPSGLTADDVTKIISGQNFAKPEDIQAAIKNINIPQGLTKNDVESIVSTALTKNPSLTTDQVSQIVNNAITKIPSGITANDVQSIVSSSIAKIPTGLTASDVTKIISQQNFATNQDIQTAIGNIKIPQGLTTADVQGIVSKAFANNPSLTSAQVSQIVNGAISQIPAGLSANDVKSIVGSAISSLPKAPTTQDIVNIISGQGLASTSQLNQQGQQLMAALQKQGVDYNTALQQALKAQTSSFNSALGTTQANIDALAQSLGKTKEGLLAELNMTEADLQKQISGVQTSLGSQITNLSQQTQQQLAQQSAQTQQQFSTLSDAQKAQADALVKQGSTLSSAINQVQAGLGQQITNLSQQTQNQLAQQSAQTQQQFNSLTAAQKAQADALVSQGATFNTALNQVQTGLGQQIGNVQSNLEAQLNAQGKALLASLQQQGLDYQTALSNALTAQANQFQNQITGVQTGLESQLDAQGKQFLEALQERGVDYKTALDEAIAQQNAKIGEVQTSFEEQLAKSTASSSADFAKLMQTLGLMGTTINAIQAANTPKTYTYNLADPSTWGSPVYNKTTGPVSPITPLDFGTRDLLKGTQWEKFLDPNYGQVPQPVQFNQPSNMSYDRLMSVLGAGADTLPSQALSINDVISGIQNQYGQAPKGTMG